MEDGKNSYVNLLGIVGAKREAKAIQDSILTQLNALNKRTNIYLDQLLQSYFTF